MTSKDTRDPLLAVLEIGLIAIIVLAPLPFGAVRGDGRLALELAGVGLLALWTVRHVLRGGPVPPRAARVATFGLLALALFQAAPTGEWIVRVISPGAAAIRDSIEPGAAEQRAEDAVLGVPAESLDATWSLSLAPDATWSAIRTGSALIGFWLVAFTVTAESSSRRVIAAILVSGAFQAAYGILVLVSGYGRVWGVPKQHFLDCATGTFVNRNHFANFVAIAAVVGVALTTFVASRIHRRSRGRLGWVTWFDAPSGRVWLVIGLTTLTVAGLLVSFSRAGTVVGLLGIAVVLLAGRTGSPGVRITIATVLLVVATGPLLQVGPERLVERFADTSENLQAPQSRPRVWGDSVRMGSALPLAGAGFGTFAEVYPTFRSPEIRLRFEHAHNDVVQIFAEGGLIGLALALVLIASHGPAWLSNLRGRRGILGVGLAAALLAGGLHALVDFPLHIPATATLLAVVAGATLGMVWNTRP